VNGGVLLLVAALLMTGIPGTPPPQSRVIQWASPTQGEAFAYGPFPQCTSGGWGSGKTFAYCLKALWISETYPKNRGVIARHVGRELRETTMATFYKICPPHLYDRRRGGRRSDQHGYLRLADSLSEILFIHLDDPETEGIIKGLEINWFLIDQAEENVDQMEELFDMLLGRLGRWDIVEVPQYLIEREEAETGKPWPFRHPETDRPVSPPYPMLCCNPDVETHWIYRRFHPESHEHQTEYKAQGYRMFHMPSEENRFLGETNRKFLLAHDTAFVRRNVHGLWGIPEGAIHAIDKRSLVPGSPELLEYFRHQCLLFRLLDHGDSAPTCCLWAAVDKNGNVFFYREYYLPNALVSTHRQNITALSEYERYEQDLADPSVFNPTMQSLKKGRFAISDEYADVTDQPRETAIFWTAADNNELGTRNRINEYLRVDLDRVHPITHTYGSPRLFFVQISDDYPQGCYHALRETRSQRRVKIGTDLGRPIFSDERDPTIRDHAYDPVRYMMATRPGVPVPESVSTEGTFFGAQQRLAALQRKRMGIR
jgi:hypothetical protein